MVGKHLIEKKLRIPVHVDCASEFRYKDPIINEETLTIVLSQSGETIDTLEALKLAKKRGSKVLSIVNVKGSTIARESDYVLYTHARSGDCGCINKGIYGSGRSDVSDRMPDRNGEGTYHRA